MGWNALLGNTKENAFHLLRLRAVSTPYRVILIYSLDWPEVIQIWKKVVNHFRIGEN